MNNTEFEKAIKQVLLNHKCDSEKALWFSRNHMSPTTTDLFKTLSKFLNGDFDSNSDDFEFDVKKDLKARSVLCFSMARREQHTAKEKHDSAEKLVKVFNMNPNETSKQAAIISQRQARESFELVRKFMAEAIALEAAIKKL